jgi:predicted unusual protein kinase regulating ubiquinone biosynthesis (AarF/ABC1/UbiB family)
MCAFAICLHVDEKRSARAKSLASYLLESILNLGPTFIKVGQLCSTRSDLFPAEVNSNALSHLHKSNFWAAMFRELHFVCRV